MYKLHLLVLCIYYHLHYFGNLSGMYSIDGSRIVGRSFMGPASNYGMCGIFFDEPDWSLQENAHPEICSRLSKD